MYLDLDFLLDAFPAAVLEVLFELESVTVVPLPFPKETR